MNKKFASPVKVIRRNKTKILATAVVLATTTAVLFRIGLKQHDDFLKEHDLYNEFYTPED